MRLLYIVLVPRALLHTAMCYLRDERVPIMTITGISGSIRLRCRIMPDYPKPALCAVHAIRNRHFHAGSQLYP
jgi:hypothetical protein